MTIGFECSKDSKKTHNCQHTEEQEYCIECYTELHYYLTNKKQDCEI